MRKIYIGYDLGDGETIIDLVTFIKRLTSKTDFDDVTMPDSNDPGKAMPSIFAYDENGKVVFSTIITMAPEEVKKIVINFKRRPSDLLKGDIKGKELDLIDMLKKKINSSSTWPSSTVWPTGNTDEMLKFKDSVITFTNAIFTNENFVNRVRTKASSSDEVVFCVGHPTNWSELDVVIYELIIRNSVLGTGTYVGKKSSIIMEAESRAAYLYAKDRETFERLPKGSSVLLIDIGSSTIDLTAMRATTNNYDYNTGSNYLGARSIDFMIRNWYLEELRKNPMLWSMYEKLLKENSTISSALVLACRKAKEMMYSANASKVVIYFSTFPGITLKKEVLNGLIEHEPIGKVLKEMIDLPEEVVKAMGNKSWKMLFKEFLQEKKAEMTRRGINVAHIILTGSASKMPFVSELISAVFGVKNLAYDMDPSRTISKGLALVGPANEISIEFMKEVNQLIEKKLPEIIKKNIPALAEEMGDVIADIITPEIKNQIERWRDGYVITLNDMNQNIKNICSERNLTTLLKQNRDYNKTIKEWLEKKVGVDIAIELKALCQKYGANDIKLENLNIMTVPSVNPDVNIDILAFMNVINKVVSLIAGIIAGASITTIMTVVILVISMISETLAGVLFALIVAAGPVGLAVLAAVVGVGVVVLVSDGVDAFKDMFKEKVQRWDLPKWTRKLINDAKIDKSIADANISKQIKDAFKDKAMVDTIAIEVSKSLKGQVEQRAQEIKYAIQSK